MSNYIARIVDSCSIFRQNCLLCTSLHATNGICAACLADLQQLPASRCQRCALPLADNTCCGRCQCHPPAYDALHVCWVFCEPLRGLLHAFKFGKRLSMASMLGHLLADHNPPSSHTVDLIIPVPLSEQRLAERGFNQSYELARSLPGIMTGTISPEICWRKCNTIAQTRLRLRQRLRNMREVFGVKARLDGLSVAIVDDVVTTGATLDSLAQTLKKQGAKRVEAWALSRALH